MFAKYNFLYFTWIDCAKSLMHTGRLGGLTFPVFSSSVEEIKIAADKE